VYLGVADGEPALSNTCPIRADASFSKHAVTVALVATEPRAAQKLHDVESHVYVRSFLEGHGNEQLVDLGLALVAAAFKRPPHWGYKTSAPPTATGSPSPI
jgi:hypothetical protein